MTKFYNIPSKTVRGLVYKLRSDEDGVKCDCPSNIIRGWCRHSELVKQVEEAKLRFVGED